MPASYRHVPVLLNEVLDLLQPTHNQRFIDGTLGGGGHAAKLLARIGPEGKVLGFELDSRAREAARKTCAKYGSRLVILPRSYAELSEALHEHRDFSDADGFLLDLGVSSDQLDRSGRGFSFNDRSVVDMRFDPREGESVSDFLKRASEKDIAAVLKNGDVRDSFRIARAIVRLRSAKAAHEPIIVPELVEAVVRVSHRQKTGIHPATLVFQALRMAVNHELERIRSVLPQAAAALKVGGRIAVISYHSLEDRIVKDFFKQESRDCICPPKTPVCRCSHHASIRIITKKPLRPSAMEIRANPRSRSARLRVGEVLSK